jgi:hypothetical protein
VQVSILWLDCSRMGMQDQFLILVGVSQRPSGTDWALPAGTHCVIEVAAFELCQCKACSSFVRLQGLQ